MLWKGANVSEELPGALTEEELAENPRQADPNNVQNRFGRDYDFVHAAFAEPGNGRSIVVGVGWRRE